MSSWHQRAGFRRNGGPPKLHHETLWTVVVNPPNEAMGVIRFATSEEAYAYQKKVTHSTVLPPSSTHPHYYTPRRNSDKKEG